MVFDLAGGDRNATTSFVQILLNASDASGCPDRIGLVEHK